MPLKNYLPKNSSLRSKITVNKKLLNLKKFKQLFLKKKFNNSGRNNLGLITVRHKGGGVFNFKRIIDIFRSYFNKENEFISFDIDNKHTAFLGLIRYLNGNFSYIIAPNNFIEKQNITTTFYSEKILNGYSFPIG